MSSPDRQRVKKIFAEAAGLSEVKRAAYLETACEGDEALRAEVASLLEHHDPAATIIDLAGNRGPGSAAAARRFRPALRSLPTLTTGFSLSPRMGARRRAFAIVAAVLLLSAIGLSVRSSVKNSLENILVEKLATILVADALALEIWIDERVAEAGHWASDSELRLQVEQLERLAREDPGNLQRLRDSPARDAIYSILDPYLTREQTANASLIDPAGRVIAHREKERVGLEISPLAWKYISQVFDGESVFVPPIREKDVQKNPSSSLGGDAHVAVCAPVRDSSGRVVASLNLSSPAEGRFTEILSVARMGDSGETYAFDEHGVMISESRFTADLVKFGLVQEEPGSLSALQIELRDPGGDLYRQHRPTRERAAQPLTKLAALAIAARGNPNPGAQRGTIIKPYRDYRGVEVIGAWQWLKPQGFGIATEVDAAEAFTPLLKLDLAFATLFGLLTIATGAYLYSSFSITSLRREIGAARQLGSYTLVEKIGEGGMGEVYLARHTMLVRPTAIKVLKEEFATDEFTKRFEREVQLASQLNHPNTIEIYDYGRSEDGILYYAMEFIEGLDLAALVKEGGPVCPARAVFILRQVCASLREAHLRKIVHRDIKPQNIMLCRRGGDLDVVKVLDFGLVKDLGNAETVATAPARVTGTPQYMAPERIGDAQNVDARADLYSVGAVGYFLLSGRNLFGDAPDLEILFKVANERPTPLEEVVDQSMPPALRELIMGCLEKDPADRPESADGMLTTLSLLEKDHPWAPEDARKWWEGREASPA